MRLSFSLEIILKQKKNQIFSNEIKLYEWKIIKMTQLAFLYIMIIIIMRDHIHLGNVHDDIT